MNLSEHFQPIEARDEALNTVRRSARRRSITHKVSMGGGLAVTLLVVFAVPTLATGYFFNVGSSARQTTSTPSANSGASSAAAPAYRPNSDFIGPEAQPGGLHLLSPWFVLLGLAVVVITTVMSLFQNGTAIRFSRRERIQLTIGALFVLFGLMTRFMH